MIKNLTAPFKAPFRRPGKDRVWAKDQALIPEISISGSKVTVKNVRNIRWVEGGKRGVYETRTYDLDAIETAWFVLSLFGLTGAMAHTFISFGFNDGTYVSISVEARRERREPFSPWRGLWRQYELTDVIADERDMISLRTHMRNYETYLYRVEAELPKIRGFFKGMVMKADDFRTHPEFYHSLWNTCTTNLVKHINEVTPRRVPKLDLRVLLPGYADRLAYRLGLIRGGGDFAAVRDAHKINARALAAPLDENWSKAIRAAPERSPSGAGPAL